MMSSDDVSAGLPVVAVPTEGPKGWLVVFLSFSCCCVAASHGFCYAVFYIDMCHDLNIPPYQGLLVLSLCISIISLMGPFGSAFINRFGFSPALYIGGTLSVLSLSACYFTVGGTGGFLYLVLFYSIGVGIGSNLVLLVGVIAPTLWFSKRRVLAIGLASSGGGVPGIVGAPIATLINTHVGWRYCFLYLSCIAAIALVLGVLMPSPPAAEVEIHQGQGTSPSLYSRVTVKDYVGTSRFTLKEVDKPKGKKQKVKPLAREDIFYQGDLKRVTSKEGSMDYTLAVTRIPMPVRRRTIQFIKKWCRCSVHTGHPSSLKEFFSIELLKTLPFNIINLINFFSSFVFSYSYIQFRIWKESEPENITAYLVTAFCCGMVVGRITLGVVQMYIPFISSGPCLYIAYVTLFLLSECIVGFRNYIPVLYVASCTYGLLGGIFVPIRSLLIIDYLGIKNLTSSMGLMFVSQGFGSLAGPPFLEMITRTSGMMGLGFVIVGLIYLMLIALVGTLLNFGKLVR